MTYKLEFKNLHSKNGKTRPYHQRAIQEKLKERLENPHVHSAALPGAKTYTKSNCANLDTASYTPLKIKLLR